jgi:DNA-binding winged helix-turn-helix (wHTH) protein
MDPTNRRRFDDYEIDLGTGELRRNGRPVPLQRQPARVLARLVASAGTLVPREALHAAVWGDGVHVDFERGLNYCIRQLRQTFDDDPKAPRFIETVARQGYRFVAAVHSIDRLPVVSDETSGRRTKKGTVPFFRNQETHEKGDSPLGLRRPHRPWRLALVGAGVLVVGLAVDRLAGGNPQHHEMAAAVVRALHDAVF